MPLIAYLDEAGDHALAAPDRDFPVFALSLLVVDTAAYARRIVPAVYALKLDLWGHEGVILHSRDIRKAQGPFAFLTEPGRRGAERRASCAPCGHTPAFPSPTDDGQRPISARRRAARVIPSPPAMSTDPCRHAPTAARTKPARRVACVAGVIQRATTGRAGPCGRGVPGAACAGAGAGG